MTATQLCNISVDGAERQFHDGLMSPRDWERFIRLWIWAAPRYSSVFNANDTQYRFKLKHGRPAFVRRMNRLRRVIGAKPYPEE